MIRYHLFAHDPNVVRRSAGEFLFRRGEYGDCMYVLMSGTAEVRIGDVVVEIAGQGDVMGETSVVEPGPHLAEVRALTDCEFVEVSAARFEFLVSQVPHFATDVLRTLTRRLRAMDGRLDA
ncbi:MAG: cyclic nucleotide-binding domain-containing protein [Rhodocyclaceae bacterium]|nr:cyclic nucleotide-binding domain-containing protein [Rhodocyclaceae bacterium]